MQEIYLMSALTLIRAISLPSSKFFQAHFFQFLKAITPGVPGNPLAPLSSLWLKLENNESENHEIGSYEINKISLSCFDDKRYILEDGITSYANEHKHIVIELTIVILNFLVSLIF